MSDPVDERLRSYYQSIQSDAPGRLEARVARALDSAPAPLAARAAWRPAFGLAAVGAAVVIVALVVRGIGPGPTASPSGVIGPSPSPIPTASATPTQGPSVTTTPTAPTPMPSATTTPVRIGLRPTGAMSPVLIQGTATPLADGRVLFAGGMSRATGVPDFPIGNPHPVPYAEVYDPATGQFTQTGSMAEPRVIFTATRLRDGRVLVVGGADQMDGFGNSATAELYDPATGKFAATGSMSIGRAAHTATLLADGRVLVTGGYGGGTSPLASAEIYDPATGKFKATGSMTVARHNHTATLLADGHVLIAGGQTENPSGTLASAEIYDPATGTFNSTGSMTGTRYGQYAVKLADGRILIAGGTGGSGDRPLNTAELYDPTAGKFSRTASMAGAGSAVGALLTDGRVLVVCVSTLSVFDPDSGAFEAAGQLKDDSVASATLLPGGRVLLVASDYPQLFQP
jgi:hypothetical protein